MCVVLRAGQGRCGWCGEVHWRYVVSDWGAPVKRRCFFKRSVTWCYMWFIYTWFLYVEFVKHEESQIDKCMRNIFTDIFFFVQINSEHFIPAGLAVCSANSSGFDADVWGDDQKVYARCAWAGHALPNVRPSRSCVTGFLRHFCFQKTCLQVWLNLVS